MASIGKQQKRDTGIARKQQQIVVKANELIQQGRFSLNIQQNKVLLYLISQIKPNDSGQETYCFSVDDFCRACGIDHSNGKNIINAKKALNALDSMSIWVQLPNNTEIRLRWLDRIMLNKNTNTFEITFHRDMLPYLYDLQTRYTSYTLANVLTMESKYGIRLYELLKSYQHVKDHTVTFSLDELKKRIDGQMYTRYPDFKRRVLDIAIEDINEYSDIHVEYEPFSSLGKKIGMDSVTFTITEPEGMDRKMRNIRRERKLDADTKEGFQALMKAITPENRF